MPVVCMRAAFGATVLGSDEGWIKFLAGIGAIMLTFLAGAELDPIVFKKKWKEATTLGLAGFFFPRQARSITPAPPRRSCNDKWRHPRSARTGCEDTFSVLDCEEHLLTVLAYADDQFQASQSLLILRNTRLTMSVLTASRNSAASARRTRRVLVPAR